MTTPPMLEITWQQAAKARALTWWDRLITSGVPAWRVPTGDRVTLPRDYRPVQQSIPTVWPAYYKGAQIGVGDPSKMYESVMPGVPIERVGPHDLSVWVTSRMRGKPRMEQIPVPARPWIEGHPYPGGMWDRHWIGVYPDGSSWELIWLAWNPFAARWEAMEAGRWDADGELVSGVPVIAAGVQLGPLILTKDTLTAPHVLALGLSDYGRDRSGSDGQLDVAFPLPGDHVVLAAPRPKGLTGDAGRVWDIAMSHGFIVRDRSGLPTPAGSITVQPGAQWAGSNLSTLRIPVEALQLVTR